MADSKRSPDQDELDMRAVAENDMLGSSLAAERHETRVIMDAKIANGEPYETERERHNTLLLREIEADRARMHSLMSIRTAN